MQNKILLHDAISLIKNKIDYDISHLDSTKKEYLNFNAFSREYKDLSKTMGKKFLKRRIQSGDIAFKTNGEIIEYSLHSIYKYLYDLEIFKNNFLDVKTAIIKLGYSKVDFKGSAQEIFKLLDQKGIIKLINLSTPINHRQTFFINKFELEDFINSHITYIEAAKILNVGLATFRQYWLPKYNGTQINLISIEPNLCFVNKESWYKFSIEKNKANILSTNNCLKKLNVSDTAFNLIIKEYEINKVNFEYIIESVDYYKEKDIEFLITEQNKKFNYYRENYYTKKETLEIFGLKHNNLQRDYYASQIEVIQVPPIIYINKDGFNLRSNANKNVYRKSDVDSVKKERDFKKITDFILMNSIEAPFTIFTNLCNHLNIEFSPLTLKTKKLWLNYIYQKLNNSHATENTLRSYIRTFISCTEILLNTIQEKEVYTYSTKHLKLNIFSEKYTKEARNELSKFLSKVHIHCLVNKININYSDDFPNYYSSTRNSDKEIYSLEEYKEFFRFLNSKEIHLEHAISAAISQINGNKSNLYDSVWLYCLLHLNNAWRHYDVTIFPEISLDGLTIANMEPVEALNFLKTNELSSSEVNLIIYRCKSLNLTHSKTKKKRYFFCSKELANTFAHAVVICTIRKSKTTPLSNMVIETDTANRTIKDKFLKKVFENNRLLPTFKSKNFNRTVISLIYSIIKKQTNGNPLDLVKIVRGHVDIETTNIYTDIPQKDLDFITKQLFDLGNFGHVYDTLANLLQENSIENNTVDVISPQIVKSLFGEIYTVEESVSLIKTISSERDSVLELLSMNSIEENSKIKLNLTLGQSPAKQENYQCIFQKCKLTNYDCAFCPYAIFNFYNINELCSEFVDYLEEFLDNFVKTSYAAEKKRMANKLYFYLMLLQDFKKAFGEDVLNLFLPFKFNDLRSILKEIPSSKQFTTIANRQGN